MKEIDQSIKALMCVCVCVCRTPLHCAASCNSVHLCKLLVESGAAIFATTISDVETAADKCEEMEEGFIQCSQFLYGKSIFLFLSREFLYIWPSLTPSDLRTLNLLILLLNMFLLYSHCIYKPLTSRCPQRTEFRAL